MKRLSAFLASAAACLCHGAVLPPRGVAPKIIVARHTAFLAKRDGLHNSGEQPWLYNPPAAPLPRAKPLDIPGDPLVLPPVDAMWGMQPSASPPTIEPPEKPGETGLQATIPPKELDGWYATIPPQQIKDGLVDDRQAYYLRCLGGPGPCPFTVPPAVLRYWMPVSQAALSQAEASTSLANTTEPGETVLPVTTQAGFVVGREVIIDAGTPIQEINYVAGMGSLLLKFPLKYAHLKGVLITMPKIVMTTPAPTMPPMQPWSSFQPFFPAIWSPGPAPFPGPAPALPMPFRPMLAIPPAPAPGPAPLRAAPAFAPPVGGPRPGPAPAPAPFR